MLSLNVFRYARTRSPFSHIRLSTRTVHERELVCGWILLGAANTALTRRSAAGGESVPGPARLLGDTSSSTRAAPIRPSPGTRPGDTPSFPSTAPASLVASE